MENGLGLENLIGWRSSVLCLSADQPQTRTLYVGITNDLIRRCWEHREGLVEWFTKRYGLDALVYYEVHEEVGAAIQREKQLKKWKRDWKLNLIERDNPDWVDLYENLM